MKGVQSLGVFSTGKHFSGHGDTDTDSHKNCQPLILLKKEIKEIEFYPYKKMFHEGSSVMVAHLSVPV
jgi:beta-glucosidase-like glycosyl hydrolase